MKINDFNTIKEKYLTIFEDFKSEIIHNDTPEIKEYREKAFEKLKSFEYTQADIEKYRDSGIFEQLNRERELNINKNIAHDDEFVCSVSELEAVKFCCNNGKLVKECDTQIKNVELNEIRESESFNELGTDFLELLNVMFFQSGFHLKVNDNSTIDKNIQFTRSISHSNDLFVTYKNRVELGENSELNLIICSHTKDDHFHLTNTSFELSLKANARINILELQSESSEASQINTVIIDQDASAVVSHKIISISGGYIRNNLNINLNGEYAENEVSGMYLSDHKQKVSNHIQMNHNVGNCYSNQLFKGVLDEYSSSLFTGKIYVKKDAQHTNAFQSNKNILLSKTARALSKPQLEIYADDVKCSHGATIGEIDADAILYLKSRGITEKEAIHMLKFAFLNEVLQKIKIESIRNSVSNLVTKRLSGNRKACDGGSC